MVILGCGALGASVAELLIRGGVQKVLLIDNDKVNAGNLVRHTLTLRDVGQVKSVSLAKRLNTLTPHANVQAIEGLFPDLSPADLDRCRAAALIIDCTGSDDALQALSEVQQSSETTYVSLALGRGAHRFYAYAARGRSFPAGDFHERISPWLSRDQAEFKDADFPWEGVGCWHPVFPASADRVWAFAAAAVRCLDGWTANPPTSELVVLESGGDVVPAIEQAAGNA